MCCDAPSSGEADKSLLLYETAMCSIAYLVDSPYFHNSGSVDEKDSVLSAVHYCLGNKPLAVHHAAHEVLKNFLRFDPKRIIVVLLAYMLDIHEVVQETYSSNPLVAQGYFLPLVEICDEKELMLPVPTLLHLVFFKIGESQLQSRVAAAKLLSIVSKMKYFKGASTVRVPAVSLVSEEYLQQQCITSFKVAASHPELTIEMLLEWLLRFKSNYLEGRLVTRNQMLCYLGGWINNLALQTVFKQDENLANHLIEVHTCIDLLTY